ncbi:hypothetical protein KJ953_00050 [Patescibacteria group bacterium]|nr:hypothetical protein [Patescibacteria group bacterium]MBU1256765.1 hypothetical protein [Patescibacteria group bacterium]MBU1457840.1 hypothetical protein [Patescibacteria group bacterium]
MSPQIQKIISSGLTWEQLTPEQKTLFNDSEEIFNSQTSEFKTGATVDGALLEYLRKQMNDDLDLKASLPNHTLDQQKLIIKLVNIRREEIRLEKILKNQEALNKIKPEINKLDTKQDPRQEIIKIAHQVIPASSVIPAQAGIQSINTFINICLTSNLDLSDPKDLDLAVSIALGKNKLYEKISKAITPTTDAEYHQAISDSSSHSGLSRIITPDGFTIDTSKIPSPNQVKPVPTIKITPANSDICDTLSTEINKLRKIEDNPEAIIISRTLITQISDKQIKKLIHTINQIDPKILQQPTQSGQQAAAIIKQFPNSNLSPQAIKLKAMGLDSVQWVKLYQNTSIQKLIPPKQAYAINQQFKSLDNSQLGKEIAQPLGKVGRFFQTFTNKISGKLPQNFTRPLNYIFHPIQSIKGWLGKKTGQYIGKKLYKAFAKKVTNKTARLVAKTLLRQGLKKGVKFLAKQGLKRGLQLAIQAANVIPGLGLVLAVAIEVGSFIIEKTIGFAIKAFKNAWRSITGDDFDPKIALGSLAALPVIAATGIAGFFSTIGTATVAAASSAAGVIVASAVAGIFIYIVAFTVAPLISTIAQLESAESTIPFSGSATSCFVFDDSSFSSEPKGINTQNYLYIAIETLISQYPALINLACGSSSSGTITLIYSPATVDYCGLRNGDTIYFRSYDDCVMGPAKQQFATNNFAHELTHIIQDSKSYESIFKSIIGAEPPMDTYPVQPPPWYEDMAESVGYYVYCQIYNLGCHSLGPNHRLFVTQEIGSI